MLKKLCTGHDDVLKSTYDFEMIVIQAESDGDFEEFKKLLDLINKEKRSLLKKILDI